MPKPVLSQPSSLLYTQPAFSLSPPLPNCLQAVLPRSPKLSFLFSKLSLFAFFMLSRQFSLPFSVLSSLPSAYSGLLSSAASKCTLCPPGLWDPKAAPHYSSSDVFCAPSFSPIFSGLSIHCPIYHLHLFSSVASPFYSPRCPLRPPLLCGL